MQKNNKIIELDQPAWSEIGEGLTEYNTRQAGDDHGQNLCFVLRNTTDEIVGGVISATYWGWLYINLMWVREDHRGAGYGAQLLAAIEKKAREQGATQAYLDTFSFQAPGFYKKFGYRVFGKLPDFPVGHTRYFLKKSL